jgi:putative ABC transport system substrate-binding protein
MRRREFIAGLGSAAAWAVVARAQQAAMPAVGYLSSQSADDDYKIVTVPFVQGLRESGFVEGQNVAIEYRWAENQTDRLPALAADLVRRRVAVIIAAGTPAALAAKAATTSIPIVFQIGTDPVALGLVPSLNRPGANVTGFAILSAELAPKRLQLLRELLPNAARFGVLVNPEFPATQSIVADLLAAARMLGLQLIFANARTESDLETAFATFAQQHIGAVLVSDSPLYASLMKQLAALPARHALPAIFPWREFALAGGLMSYGSSLGYGMHQAGIYTGRILKGEKLADLPVQQATKLELIINLSTAKALGLTIPEPLLATADEVNRLQQHERTPGRPSLRNIGPQILHRKTSGIALQATIEFRQLVQQEVARRAADVTRHCSRFVGKSITPHAQRYQRVVVRPNRACLIIIRIERRMIGGESSDAPPTPHVLPHQPFHDIPSALRRNNAGPQAVANVGYD